MSKDAWIAVGLFVVIGSLIVAVWVGSAWLTVRDHRMKNDVCAQRGAVPVLSAGRTICVDKGAVR